MSKGQIETRVIIYVLAVFVAAMILIFGFRVVTNLVGTQEEILSISFKEDLSSAVTQKSYEFKNVERLNFIVPNEYSAVCFGDLSQTNNPLMLEKIGSLGHSLIRDSMYSNVRRNVFLVRENKLRDGFYAGDLVVSADQSHFECVDVSNGEFKLRLEALGKEGVLVSGG